MRLKKLKLILLLLTCAGFLKAQQPANHLDLNGEWRFSLDFTRSGMERGWHKEEYKSDSKWDRVQVPHSFSADGRYMFFEGVGWYRKTFEFSKTAERRTILHFDAVYNRSQVWLNGQSLGKHEGGYTPFEFDVTAMLRDGSNVLVVTADNHLDSLTIPTIGSNPANNGNVGWVNYGGITRKVYLKSVAEAYIRNTRVYADPDLKRGGAEINIRAVINNASEKAENFKIGLQFFKDGKIVPAKVSTKPLKVDRHGEGIINAKAILSPKFTKLWDLDHPELYQVKVIAGKDTQSVTFGIRKVEVRDAKLYLNGRSIKYGGGNLVLDYPKFGSVVNDTIADKYLRMMKNGGMEFQRLTHYPLPSEILEWADRNGMLIITEAGNWGYQKTELSNPRLRKVYKQQLKEMIEANWNHPSVIAYSVGNEYDSHIPAGVDWTRDMFAFIQAIDSTRLKTVVSNKLNHEFGKAENEASYYADFICTNIYDSILGIEKTLQKIERLYPDKPILVSEWGKRADQVKTEAERSVYIQKAMAVFRKSDHVVGSAWWSVNDYYSRYAGSNADGQRPWGLLDYHLLPRAAYFAQQAELSPVLITKKSFSTETGTLTIEIHCKSDFPSYTLKGYTLKYGNKSVGLKAITPGERVELELILDSKPDQLNIQLLKPTGFLATNTLIQLK